MNEGHLTQEQIDQLLKGNGADEDRASFELTDIERDVIGEAGNIFIATSATSLSKILSKRVEITTPIVDISNLRQIHENMIMPYVVLKVRFEKGINGINLLLIKTEDASLIADIMMGGDGSNKKSELNELELSAVSEAMNQMIGSAATSIAAMMQRVIDISSPETEVWSELSDIDEGEFNQEDDFVKISFDMKIDGLLTTTIMQLYSIETVKEIVGVLTGSLEVVEEQNIELVKGFEEVIEPEFEDSVEPLTGVAAKKQMPNNIDILLDVLLELNVVFGKTKKSIKDILSFGEGTVIELDEYVDEPLEIYANNKLIAYGEVVVVDEKFGIRVTDIISAERRFEKIM